MKKVGLSLLIAMVMIAALFCAVTTYAASSGTCGENLTWTLDNDGTLTISGSGDMHSGGYGWDNYNIKNVVIGENVTSIGDFAFNNCNLLTSITIPDSVTSIGWYAFSYCKNLTSVTIPDSVISIGNYAFRSCDKLTSINISDSVTSIGDWVFWYCDNLTSVTIGSGVTSIGNNAFMDCIGLAEIDVATGNRNYCSENGVLFNKNKTTLIHYPSRKTETTYIIPDSVTSVGYAAFQNCQKLTSVTIPGSVTSIGNSAFRYSGKLITVTISDSVTSIGTSAFGDCDNLKTVKYRGAESEWNAIEIGPDNDPLINARKNTPLIVETAKSGETGYEIQVAINKDKTEAFENAKLVVVLYDENGKFAGLGATEVSASDATKTIQVEAVGTVYDAKIMLWDTLESINPLCEDSELALN